MRHYYFDKETNKKSKKESVSTDPFVYFVNLIDKKGSQGRLGCWLYATFCLLSDLKGSRYTVNLLKGISNDTSQPIENFIKSIGALSLTNRENITDKDFQIKFEKSSSSEIPVAVRYIWLDYHFQYRRNGVSSINALFDHLKSAVQSQNSIFLECGSDKSVIFSKQSCVIRTNCIDCLDRTNVVQVLLIHIY
jgi:hypothetical protein